MEEERLHVQAQHAASATSVIVANCASAVGAVAGAASIGASLGGPVGAAAAAAVGIAVAVASVNRSLEAVQKEDE
jgi:predicted MFS family arabinose efflux permease